MRDIRSGKATPTHLDGVVSQATDNLLIVVLEAVNAFAGLTSASYFL